MVPEGGDTEQQQSESDEQGYIYSIPHNCQLFMVITDLLFWCTLTRCIFGNCSYLNSHNQASMVHTLYFFLLNNFLLRQNHEGIWSKTNNASRSKNASQGNHQLLPSESKNNTEK